MRRLAASHDFTTMRSVETAGLRRTSSPFSPLTLSPRGLRLAVQGAPPGRYANAQVDDYAGLPRRGFPWSPPLTLTVRARFSHEAAATAEGGGLLGTAGFGFWNDPFMMTEPRPPALPRALWFFYGSRPGNLKLDIATPGHGWKAAVLDALRPCAAPWAVAAPLLIPLMNVPAVYRVIWPRIQSALRIREAPVPGSMTAWRTYTIEWGGHFARCLVDGEVVLDVPFAPRGPLGFVMWCDNQYMVATPWGRFRWGVLSVPGEQWLEASSMTMR